MEHALTAAENIMALEAKFDSTVKSLNKKVSFENKKGGSGGKKHSQPQELLSNIIPDKEYRQPVSEMSQHL